MATDIDKNFVSLRDALSAEGLASNPACSSILLSLAASLKEDGFLAGIQGDLEVFDTKEPVTEHRDGDTYTQLFEFDTRTLAEQYIKDSADNLLTILFTPKGHFIVFVTNSKSWDKKILRSLVGELSHA